MTRKTLKEKILKNKIVIWGMGKQGFEFFSLNRDFFSELYCTSSAKSEKVTWANRIELEDIMEDFQNYYIIICSNSYDDICLKLISYGLKPIDNFAPGKLITAILYDKKIILAVGQCELEITNIIFNSMDCLQKNYLSLYYSEHKVCGLRERNMEPRLEAILSVRAIMPLADYFIYPVNFTRDRVDYYLDILKLVHCNCKCVGVPLTTFEGYWPQDNRHNYYENCDYYYQNSMGLFPFGNRRDINIEEAIENDDELILEKIQNLDFYSIEAIEKGFKKTFRKYELLERKADIKISDFLQKHYLTKRVYKDRGHAEAFVLKEYAKRILNYLEINFCECEIENVDLTWYDQNHTEFPIYPSVLKYLCFNKNMKYFYFSGKHGEYLDFARYTEYIYICMKYVKTIERCL